MPELGEMGSKSYIHLPAVSQQQCINVVAIPSPIINILVIVLVTVFAGVLGLCCFIGCCLFYLKKKRYWCFGQFSKIEPFEFTENDDEAVGMQVIIAQPLNTKLQREVSI